MCWLPVSLQCVQRAFRWIVSAALAPPRDFVLFARGRMRPHVRVSSCRGRDSCEREHAMFHSCEREHAMYLSLPIMRARACNARVFADRHPCKRSRRHTHTHTHSLTHSLTHTHR